MGKPKVYPGVSVFAGAAVVGEVALAQGVSVWYNAVVRGDCAQITVGENTNIQDCAVLHADEGCPLTIGRGVTVGHGAILHGCTIGDNVLVGMGAIVMNGAVVGKNCVIGAGALVTQGTVLPEGTLWMGSPAKQRRALLPEEIAHNAHSAQEYLRLAQKNAGVCGAKQE